MQPLTPAHLIAGFVIKLNDEYISRYQELNLNKKFSYIMHTLSEDNSEIIVDKTSENRNYEDFVHDLPPTECRWVVYDFQDERDGVNRNKMVFISWKMLFPSSKEALRRNFTIVAVDINARDLGDVSREAVSARCGF
ncbi:unnamed protein product [Penicillium nalgiovense]|uniref:Cofilin n=1 Tax=Penicillium nalgiovense TaxID=60175 RepID=A0A9W4I248_PENNA|nr:unnamed protein product [Penicillium nalgiovense]CAG8002064.1 unnamed protein product [Penicillium nalgiovense]CAG8090960.1 unnamed protein product [Penicillium nalgiovense]CAG8108028.1 unnamed protein product [Penicillium nalgiovense]CAG8109401.1 unnamed protein product [Penicillium nalgiovense]